MVSLDALVVSTALPTLRVRLGASLAQLEWTVNAYVLTLAVLLMTGAALGDRFGRRRMFVAGLGIFSAASAACALAQSPDTLIAGRALQGAGAALMLPLSLALLGAAFEPARRAAALGVYAAVTAAGVVFGPLLGGAAIEAASWRWIFWLNVPLGVCAMLIARRRMQESLGPGGGVDWSGLALISAGVFGLVWGLVRGNAAGWDSVEVLATIAVGVVLVGAFVAFELRAREPMLPMQMFRARSFAAGNAAIFFLFASALGAIFFVAQFLQVARGYHPLAAGLRLMPWGAAAFFVAPLVGARITRTGERPWIVTGLVLVAGAGAWLALGASATVAYWQVVAPLAIAGIGVSLALPAAQSAVVAHVSTAQLGKASGTFSTLRQLGGALGVAVTVAVFASSGSYLSPHAFSEGYAAALGVSSGLALLGAFAGMLAPGRPRVGATVASATGLVPQHERLTGAELESASAPLADGGEVRA
jgi:EmrB/QacA subfamily drug resistance transporter